MEINVPMFQSNLVVKVKHGDTLRRFNALVNGGKLLDLDMVGLREKIISLFNFPPDAELTLTYIDEDGDVVTLVDNDDLHDVVRQRLKFLRIDVHLSSDRVPTSSISSGNSTPMRSPSVQAPLPNVNDSIAELFKSVPEPLRDVMSKLSVELASVASSSNPIVAGLVEGFSKMGQSEDVAGESKQSRSSDVPDKPLKPSEESQQKSAQSDSSSRKGGDGAGSPKVTRGFEAPLNTNSSGFNWNQMGFSADSSASQPAAWNTSRTATSMFPTNIFPDSNENNSNQTDGYQKGKFVNLDGSTSFDDGAPKYTNPHVNGNPFNECPFGGMPMAEPLFHRAPFPFGPGRRRSHGPPSIFSMFHKGIQCDGCGVLPITGPRFKSKVKEDYDLCNICFSKMGNGSDYTRMDFPAPQFPRRPWCHKASNDNVASFGSPFHAGLSIRKVKPGWPKLDSRFILDVNVLDGTVMAPTTPFTKIWRMRNNGNIPWPHGLRLMWIGGDKFSDSISVGVEVPLEGVPVEGELDVAVDFTAPELPGRYISYWRLASPSGVKFGQRVWVLIQVDASLKDSTFDGLPGFNLNLPPTSNGIKDPEIIDMNAVPIEECNADAVAEPLKSMVDEQPRKEQDLDFDALAIHLSGNNVQASAPPGAQSSSSTLPQPSSQVHPITGEGVAYVPEVSYSPTVSYPEVQPSTANNPMAPSSSKMYPIIDLSEPAPAIPSMAPNPTPLAETPASAQGTGDGTGVEQSLLKELEAMGFKQVDLNKEILRMNDYDLEKSVDDLCGVNEWDPILEELQEMGFRDVEMNKKLLKKNNGSIKGVVMDLLTGERDS